MGNLDRWTLLIDDPAGSDFRFCRSGSLIIRRDLCTYLQPPAVHGRARSRSSRGHSSRARRRRCRHGRTTLRPDANRQQLRFPLSFRLVRRRSPSLGISGLQHTGVNKAGAERFPGSQSAIAARPRADAVAQQLCDTASVHVAASLHPRLNERGTGLRVETEARGDSLPRPSARRHAQRGAIGAMLKGLTGGIWQVRGRQSSTARIDGELRPMLRGQRTHGHTSHAMFRAGADGA